LAAYASTAASAEIFVAHSSLRWTRSGRHAGAPTARNEASYLETLSRGAGEEAPPADPTKAQVSERIDALQQQTGRGA